MLVREIPVSTSFVSAASKFSRHVEKIKVLDIKSQSLQGDGLSHNQVQRLINRTTEALLLSLFTEYEFFIENILILSAFEKPLKSGRKSKSYLKPTNYKHALNLIIGGKDFGKWNDPESVINTSERVVYDGFPVKDIIVNQKDNLQQLHWVRNRIAHKSEKAQRQFKKAVLNKLNSVPLGMEGVGGFLNTPLPNQTKRVFQEFIEDFESIPTTLLSL